MDSPPEYTLSDRLIALSEYPPAKQYVKFIHCIAENIQHRIKEEWYIYRGPSLDNILHQDIQLCQGELYKKHPHMDMYTYLASGEVCVVIFKTPSEIELHTYYHNLFNGKLHRVLYISIIDYVKYYSWCMQQLQKDYPRITFRSEYIRIDKPIIGIYITLPRNLCTLL